MQKCLISHPACAPTHPLPGTRDHHHQCWASLLLWASSLRVSCVSSNEELAYLKWKSSPSYIFIATNHGRCCISQRIQRRESLSSSFGSPDASAEVPPPACWPRRRGMIDFTVSQPDLQSQMTALGKVLLPTPCELWKIRRNYFSLRK